LGDSVLDQRAGNAQSPLFIHETAARRHELDAGGNRLSEPHGFEQVEGRGMDAFAIALA
jgi:hypothetical protein